MGLLPFSSSTPQATFTNSGKVNQTEFNVMSSKYGAKRDGSSDDTTAINNALSDAYTNGGGKVVSKGYGTHVISAPLIIYSNTTLEIDDNITILLAANSNCNMLIDYSHSVADTTMPSTMKNIYIRGGIWNRGANGPTNSNSGHSIILGGTNVFAENLQFKSTGGLWSLLFQNAINFGTRNIYYNNTSRDGLDVRGPCQFGSFYDTKGLTGDDMFSFLPSDTTAYQWGNEGDVTDMYVDGVFVNGQVSSTVVKISSGSKSSGTIPFNTKRISINNISGTKLSGVTNKAVVFIGDAADDINVSLGYVDDITVDGIKFAVPDNTYAIVQVGGTSTSKAIPKITVKNIQTDGDVGTIVYDTHPSIGSLIVDGVQINTAANPIQNVVYLEQYYCSVGRLEMSNIDVVNNGSRNGNLIQAADTRQTLTDVYLSNCYMYGFSNLCYGKTNTSFYLSNVDIQSNDHIFYIDTGAFIVQSCNGLIAQTKVTGSVNSATIESKALLFPLDITQSYVVKNNGDSGTITANSGSISSGSPVMYNGTLWEPLALPQDIYTTSSPTFAKLKITTGSNANAGTGTLSGGTVTISTTAVTSNSLIFLQDTTPSLTNVGTLSVTSKSAGVSFTVNSTNVLDTSTFNWLIIN